MPQADDAMMFEPHAHSLETDGHMSPTQILQWAQFNGFDAIALSDHNTLAGYTAALKAQAEASPQFDNLTLVPALELSNCRLHMNVYGVTSGDFMSDPLVTELLNKNMYPSDE